MTNEQTIVLIIGCAWGLFFGWLAGIWWQHWRELRRQQQSFRADHAQVKARIARGGRNTDGRIV